MNKTPTRGSAFLYLLVAAIPGLLSLAFFRMARALLGRAKARYTAKHPESSRRWQVFSREFMEKPLVLPLILTTAPRWNPHAVIGTFGPITVREKITIDAAAARRSGEWFFVIYSHPGRETIGWFSHLSDRGESDAEFKVPHPGQYAIGARFYHPSPTIELPAVKVDGALIGGPQTIAANVNQFYHQLRARETFFHRALAYYVWVLFRCRPILPAGWIHREFLPVGNPETRFAYGIFRQGEQLDWNFTSEPRHDSDVYVTLYSRGSLPVAWFKLTAAGDAPVRVGPCDGFYLIRMQPKGRTPVAEPFLAKGPLYAGDSSRTVTQNRVAETS